MRWCAPRMGLSVLVVLLVLGCARKNDYNDDGSDYNQANTQSPTGGPVANVARITFDDSVPSDHQSLIRGDMKLASTINFQPPQEWEKQMTGLARFDSSAWTQMFDDHVNYMVGDSYDTYKMARVEGDDTYSPVIISRIDRDSTAVTTIMENESGLLYLIGKQNNWDISMPIAGRRLLIDSPMVGVIKEGPGFVTSYAVKSSSPDSLENRGLQLDVIIHELNHCKGNSRSNTLAMAHSVCKSGSMQGRSQCDMAYNGPFGAEVVFLRRYISEVCANCGSAAQETYSRYIADSVGRIDSNASLVDTRPERNGNVSGAYNSREMEW